LLESSAAGFKFTSFVERAEAGLLIYPPRCGITASMEFETKGEAAPPLCNDPVEA
jgi:hypothetical protein